MDLCRSATGGRIGWSPALQHARDPVPLRSEAPAPGPAKDTPAETHTVPGVSVHAGQCNGLPIPWSADATRPARFNGRASEVMRVVPSSRLPSALRGGRGAAASYLTTVYLTRRHPAIPSAHPPRPRGHPPRPHCSLRASPVNPRTSPAGCLIGTGVSKGNRYHRGRSGTGN